MVIFINGSINSGKSTVSKIIAKKLTNTVILEIDTLRKFIHWLPLEKSIPINLENACLLIKNFDKNNINVIVPYPISQKNYDLIMKLLKGLKTKIYFFTLDPSINIALTNRGNRKLSVWEKNRIKHHYRIGIHRPSFGEIINNSNDKPEETAKKIISKLS